MKRNALPPPSAGSTQIRPPWASTTRCQTPLNVGFLTGVAHRGNCHLSDP